MGNFTGGERGVDGQTREDLAGVHAHHANLVNARDGGFKLEQDAVLVEGRALLHGDAAGAGRAALKGEERSRRPHLVVVPVAQNQLEDAGLAGSPLVQAGSVERRCRHHGLGGFDEHGDVPLLRTRLQRHGALTRGVADARDLVDAVAEVQNLALVRGRVAGHLSALARTRRVDDRGEVRAAVVYPRPAALARDDLEREPLAGDGAKVGAVLAAKVDVASLERHRGPVRDPLL